ncbi:MAG: PUA domain-containing protein [Thermofilum sp.]
MYCFGSFTEVYLVKPRLLGAIEAVLRSGRIPYFAGMYGGRLRSTRPEFIPSHVLIERIYEHLGRPIRAVKAMEQGIKVVLYGKDLLAESVASCFEPIELGEVVSVIGPDGYVYAIGLSTISSCEEIARLRKKDVVARSVFDLGWYLRGGTIPREAKYKL